MGGARSIGQSTDPRRRKTSRKDAARGRGIRSRRRTFRVYVFLHCLRTRGGTKGTESRLAFEPVWPLYKVSYEITSYRARKDTRKQTHKFDDITALVLRCTWVRSQGKFFIEGNETTRRRRSRRREPERVRRERGSLPPQLEWARNELVQRAGQTQL